jgi:hypothetical protein
MDKVASTMLLSFSGLIVGMTLMYIWMKYGNSNER